MARGSKRRPPRRRRDPETARQELLDAAERVFASELPETAGLKRVADEAGTSHALITHYFGTYHNLVEATLQRRVRAVRARVLDRLGTTTALPRADELLAILFEALADPVHVRLLRWLLASERADATAIGLQDRGLRLVAGRVAATLSNKPTARQLERVENAVLAIVAAAFGWAVGKHVLASALGRPASADVGPDDALRHTLAEMAQLFLGKDLDGS
jgi:AcrR family transcriptional regulator